MEEGRSTRGVRGRCSAHQVVVVTLHQVTEAVLPHHPLVLGEHRRHHRNPKLDGVALQPEVPFGHILAALAEHREPDPGTRHHPAQGGAARQFPKVEAVEVARKEEVDPRLRTRMLDRSRCTVFAIVAPSFRGASSTKPGSRQPRRRK